MQEDPAPAEGEAQTGSGTGAESGAAGEVPAAELIPPLESLPELPGQISPAGPAPEDSGKVDTVIPWMQMD